MNDKEEYIKCLKDPYYFFKKYCGIKDKKTGKIVNMWKQSREIYSS